MHHFSFRVVLAIAEVQFAGHAHAHVKRVLDIGMWVTELGMWVTGYELSTRGGGQQVFRRTLKAK